MPNPATDDSQVEKPKVQPSTPAPEKKETGDRGRAGIETMREEVSQDTPSPSKPKERSPQPRIPIGGETRSKSTETPLSPTPRPGGTESQQTPSRHEPSNPTRSQDVPDQRATTRRYDNKEHPDSVEAVGDPDD